MKKKIKEKIYLNLEKVKNKEKLLVIYNKTISFIKKTQFEKEKELCICHNDLYYENILYNLDNKKFDLIDFEFCGLNLPFSDLINLINEFIIDYTKEDFPFFKIETKNFPKKNKLKLYIKAYLFFYKNKKNYRFYKNDFLENFKNIDEFKNINDDEIVAVYNDIPFMGKVDCYFNILWGLYCFDSEISIDQESFIFENFKLVDFYDNLLEN